MLISYEQYIYKAFIAPQFIYVPFGAKYLWHTHASILQFYSIQIATATPTQLNFGFEALTSWRHSLICELNEWDINRLFLLCYWDFKGFFYKVLCMFYIKKLRFCIWQIWKFAYEISLMSCRVSLKSSFFFMKLCQYFNNLFLFPVGFLV